MKFLFIPLKISISILFLIAIIGYGNLIYSNLMNISTKSIQLKSFIGGGTILIFFWFFYFSKRNSFWSVLEHELTHAIFALIFFKKIHTLGASRSKGGHVSLEGGNFLIALAPYYFPLATFFILCTKCFIQYKYHVLFNGLIGFTYFFHLLNLFREFHPGQADLKIAGYGFSLIFVTFINILIFGIIISSLPGGWMPIFNFLKNGGIQTIDNLGVVFEFFYQNFVLIFNGM